MKSLRLNDALSRINRLEAGRGILLDVLDKGGARRGELIAPTLEFISASEIILALFVKLFGTVRLIEPKRANRASVVANNTLSDSQAFAAGADEAQVANFTTNDNFAGP